MDLDDQNRKRPYEFEFDFLGERYKYSVTQGSLQKIGVPYSSIGIIKKDINKKSVFVNKKELEKIANESFAEVNNFIKSNLVGESLFDSVTLSQFRNIVKNSSSEFYEKLQLYSQKLEHIASPFGEAQRLLEKIIEENGISKEDPEKAVLQALARVKDQGKKVVIDYDSISRLACDLKKNELRRKQNETA